MENLNLDQLFSLIKLHYEEKKDIKVLKEFFQNKILNERPFETKLYQTLKIITSKYTNRNIRILDYGCGGGKLLFFLYALGYKNIKGCDVLDNYGEKKHIQISLNNDFFKELVGEKNVFSSCKQFVQKAENLTSYKNQSFDLILSEQVLEHCQNLDGYTNECLRLLDQNGSVYLTFNQRLRPFENHINTWFIHWFPKTIRNFWLDIFRKKQGGSKFYEKLLNLKTVFYFKKLFKSKFKHVDFLTAEYLGETNIKYYKRRKTLRKIFNFLFNLRLIGFFFRTIVANFSNPKFIIYK